MPSSPNQGSDFPIESLQRAFQACLPPNKATPECDRLVGSIQAGSGYCGPNSGYANNTYCACVNSDIPCPMVAAARCSNAEYSYKPTAMLPGGTEFDTCNGRPLCFNTVDVGGEHNVTAGVQQCGPIENFTNSIQANPILALFVFILLIALIVLTAPSSRSAQSSESPVSKPVLWRQ